MDREIVAEVINGRINPALIKFAGLDPTYWIRMLDGNDLEFALKAVDKRL